MFSTLPNTSVCPHRQRDTRNIKFKNTKNEAEILPGAKVIMYFKLNQCTRQSTTQQYRKGCCLNHQLFYLEPVLAFSLLVLDEISSSFQSVLFLSIHFSFSKRFLNQQACEKTRRQTGSDEPQPTIMENPIGPLITQLGTGLSFLSQHLRAP